MRTILAVDDNPTFLIAYRVMVPKDSYQLATESPTRALGIISANSRLDLLITDLGIPELIEAANKDPDLKIILATFQPQHIVDVTLKELNCQKVRAAYLQKPFEKDELLDCVRKLIGE